MGGGRNVVGDGRCSAIKIRKYRFKMEVVVGGGRCWCWSVVVGGPRWLVG